jgi:PleD family two-component response regulator
MAEASYRHRPAKDRLTTAERIVRALLPQGYRVTMLSHHKSECAEAASNPSTAKKEIGMVLL